MKRVLLDTSVYVAFKRNREDVVSGLQWASEIHLNTVVMAELLAGFKRGSREERNREELRKFLNSPRARFDVLDHGTAEFYAHLYLRLRAKGSPIPNNDMWIAASAMQHGLALYSDDAHFSAVDGLLRYGPF